MFAAMGFTPLLVNLESMTTGGGNKNSIAWKDKKAVQKDLAAVFFNINFSGLLDVPRWNPTHDVRPVKRSVIC